MPLPGIACACVCWQRAGSSTDRAVGDAQGLAGCCCCCCGQMAPVNYAAEGHKLVKLITQGAAA